MTHGYPRPLLRRKDWRSLNGTWALDHSTCADLFWYKTGFTAEKQENTRVLLHFEAIDYRANVWVNGNVAATHEGGYTPFTCETTQLLNESGKQELVVRVEDDPEDLAKPRGKQDWKLDPHSIWYAHQRDLEDGMAGARRQTIIRNVTVTGSGVTLEPAMFESLAASEAYSENTQ